MRYLFFIFLFQSFITYASFPNDLLTKNSIKNQDVAYILIDLESGKIIESLNKLKPMTLASVSKIFTNYYALKTLGSEYRYKVELYYTGKIENNVLTGNLYLVGSGSPYLTVNHLITLIQKLKLLGIKKLNGNFYLDDSELFFSENISSIGLDDQPDNPSHGALNVEFNRFKVFKGDLVYPPLENIILNEQKNEANGQKFYFAKGINGNEIWSENIKEKIKIWENLPTKDSTMFTGHLFNYLSSIHGIKLTTPLRAKITEDSKKIAKIDGLPLARLAALGMEYSNNLIAETILKTSVKRKTSNALSSKQCAEHMLSDLKKQFNNMNWNGAVFENGSGLTLNNKVSPITMAQFLKETYFQDFSNISFLSLFSINGHSGGLAKRLSHPSMAYRFYAKTGSLYYVNNVSGIMISKNNKKYAFAIFLTDTKKRNFLNQPNSIEVNTLRKESKQWYQKAISVQDQLLLNWYQKY